MSDLTMRLPHGQLRLLDKELLRLNRARGTRLQGLAGTLWVTFDNCPQDLLLEAGDSLTIDHPGGVTVSALGGPATLALDAVPPAPARTGLLAPAWQALRERLAPRPAPCPA